MQTYVHGIAAADAMVRGIDGNVFVSCAMMTDAPGPAFKGFCTPPAAMRVRHAMVACGAGYSIGTGVCIATLGRGDALNSMFYCIPLRLLTSGRNLPPTPPPQARASVAGVSYRNPVISSRCGATTE